MSSDYSVSLSEASCSSSSTITETSAAAPPATSGAVDSRSGFSASPSVSVPASSDKQGYLSASYEAKGKRRASQEDDAAATSDDVHHLSQSLQRICLGSASSLPSSSPPPSDSASSKPARVAAASAANLPAAPSSQPPDRERRIRKAREGASRSVAPSPLRSALNTSPTTGSASQFVSLLGQPVAVSASLSAPNKGSTGAASAALPSLYKASRGRSANVSPSRRWDRRGASATVLSGASASGSGGGADDPSDDEPVDPRLRHPSDAYNESAPRSSRSHRRLSVAKEEALFPSDDDDSPPFSPAQETSNPVDQVSRQHRRSRRWSSIERERSRGMRILLQERSNELRDSVETLCVARPRLASRRRTRSKARTTSATEEDASDVDSSSLPSSCTSSCDLDYIPSGGDTLAIPIKEHRSRSSSPSHGTHNASVSVSSSQDRVPSSTDGSDDPSPAASTPSTSLVQRSPPGFTALKPIPAIPVSSESDPLLGLATPSVEDMIQIDQVEFFPEEAITAQLASAQAKRKTSPKRTKKSSWIIGDFESEPESDEDPKPTKASLDIAVNRSHATATGTSPPSSSPSSYQARLASLQSQLRIWSRAQDPPSSLRIRQISSSSEDQTDAEVDAKDTESNSASLLSASWRNLTRLPNLILLPGLAARQARDSLASMNKDPSVGSDGSNGHRGSSHLSTNDFAQIYRLASSSQNLPDEKTLQAQHKVALKTGRPPSPSPSPSPPASLLGSRQSSNDSISTTDRASTAPSTASALRRGRGVASPLEADRDPSAYVSGLGQPIDPDTELSSVVQLQTFRSRSRSRPAERSQRGRTAEESRSVSTRQPVDQNGHNDRRGPLSPKKLGQAIELEPTAEIKSQTAAAITGKVPLQSSVSQEKPSELLTIQIPSSSATVPAASSRLGRRDIFAEGPAPVDTASAPTSPTFRKGTASSSATTSGDETDSIPSPPDQDRVRDSASVDADGFRIVRRRHRRRSSGPRSLRPKVDSLVPQGYSAFAIEEGDEQAHGSDSDGETTPSPTPVRRSRGRRGRDSSPRRSNRQCAVGLFGGGNSTPSSPTESSLSSSRPRRSGRREGSHIGISATIRSVRSSPDLTYAAAAASRPSGGDEVDGQDQTGEDPSPPRGSRGRRGAVKVVASSVGQRAPLPQPLLLAGREGLRRGPSYPPRAGETLEEVDGSEDDASSAASVAARGGRGRSASSPTCGNVSPQPLRFRLLSNSSHLLMLSLELDMIKKQKISAPLKPRWGKHRANDFNPLPSTISYSSSAALYASSKYLRSPFSASRAGADGDDGEGDEDSAAGPQADECQDGDCATSAVTTGAAGAGAGNRPASALLRSGLRDPSSRLRYSWSLADIASALDAAASV